jgi:hypothetical protein
VEFCSGLLGKVEAEDFEEHLRRDLGSDAATLTVRVVYRHNSIAAPSFRLQREGGAVEYWCVELMGTACLLPRPLHPGAFGGIEGFTAPPAPAVPRKLGECLPAVLVWNSKMDRWDIREPGRLRHGRPPTSRVGVPPAHPGVSPALDSTAARIVSAAQAASSAPEMVEGLGTLESAGRQVGAWYLAWLGTYRRHGLAWDREGLFYDFCQFFPGNQVHVWHACLEEPPGPEARYRLIASSRSLHLVEPEGWAVEILDGPDVGRLAGLFFLLPSVEGPEHFGGLRPAFGPEETGIHPGNVTEVVPAVLAKCGRDRCRLETKGLVRGKGQE